MFACGSREESWDRSVVGDALFDVFEYFRTGRGTRETKQTVLFFNGATDEATTVRRTQIPKKANDQLTRVVCVSDTHDRHRELGTLPEGDLFIHSGDLLMTGRFASDGAQVDRLRDFNAWLGECVPCKSRVVIAGNHDCVLPSLTKSQKQSIFSHAHWLENDLVELGGLTIFGTPMSQGSSANRAFQGADFAASTVTSTRGLRPVDILVTHGSCQSRIRGQTAGDLDSCFQHLQPKLHAWGHAHDLYGVRHSADKGRLSVCASVMDNHYRPLQLPIVVDVDLTRGKQQSRCESPTDP